MFSTYSNSPDYQDKVPPEKVKYRGKGREDYGDSSFGREVYGERLPGQVDYMSGHGNFRGQGEYGGYDEYVNQSDEQRERDHEYRENYPRSELALGPIERRDHNERESYDRLRRVSDSRAGEMQRHGYPPPPLGRGGPPHPLARGAPSYSLERGRPPYPLDRGGPYRREEGYPEDYSRGGPEHFREEAIGPWEPQGELILITMYSTY